MESEGNNPKQEMKKGKDVTIKVPLTNITVLVFDPSVTAVAKDKYGNTKAVRHGDCPLGMIVNAVTASLGNL